MLKTERLILRSFTISDFDALKKILTDPIVMQYSVTGPCTDEEITNFIERTIHQTETYGIGLLAIVHEQQGLIGFCGIYWAEIEGNFQPELGYRLAKKYWGQGYAYEAAKAVFDYVIKELKFSTLISMIESDNERSIKLAQKLGGQFLKNAIFKGIPVQIYSYLQ